MEMAKQEIVPTYQDIYDVVLVDAPETVQPRLALTGHTPREYPHLSLVYLAKRSQLARCFSSRRLPGLSARGEDGEILDIGWRRILTLVDRGTG